MKVSDHVLVGLMLIVAVLLLTMAGFQFNAASLVADLQPVTSRWLRFGGFFWVLQGIIFLVIAVSLIRSAYKDNQS